MRALIAAGAALSVGLAACGVGTASGGGDSSPPATPFLAIQPEDARLGMAAQEVKTRIGHEVNVDVDAALLKEHAAHLTAVLTDALETIARGIDRARADRPGVVLRACTALVTLKIELDERSNEPHVYVDGTSGVLLLRVPSGATYFTTDELVATAFAASE